MIDKEVAVDIANEHLAAIYPSGIDILCLAFATYAPAQSSDLSPGPSDRDGWRVYFRYTNGLEGHHIVCVDAETGEIYFTFAM